MIYHVISEKVNGRLLTAIVADYLWKEDSEVDAYFLCEAVNCGYHGTVEIEGEAEHMLPQYLIE